MIIEKYYTVADTAVCIAADEKIMYGDDGVLAPFALASVSGGVVRYEYEISDSLPDPRGTPTVSRPDIAEFGEGENTVRYIGAVANSLDGAYICTRKEGSTVRVTVKSSFCSKLSPSLILNSVSAERLAVNAGGIIFHSAYIGFRNEGILFTAPSGTGKSTQAELWREWRGADVINGDRSMIKSTGGISRVCSLPFSGSSGISKNVNLPLRAIVYLEQAPTVTLERIRGAQAFCRIWEGCCVNTWNRAELEKAYSTAEAIAAQTPVYRLRCTPDEKAVDALYCKVYGAR